jgi:hypothetical protein
MSLMNFQKCETPRVLLEQAWAHGLQWLERNFATGTRISYPADNRNAHNEIKNQERKRE